MAPTPSVLSNNQQNSLRPVIRIVRRDNAEVEPWDVDLLSDLSTIGLTIIGVATGLMFLLTSRSRARLVSRNIVNKLSAAQLVNNCGWIILVDYSGCAADA